MNLRKVSRDYVTTVLKTELEERLKANGLTGSSIEAVTTRQTSEGEKPIDHDSDPTVLNVHYKSSWKSHAPLRTPTMPIPRTSRASTTMPTPWAA